MKDRDEIKDLFSEKLRNHASEVSPKVWSAVSSQIGAAAGTTAAGTGMSLAAKILIGLGITAAATVVTVLALNSNSAEPLTPEKTKQDTILAQDNTGSSVKMEENEEKSPGSERTQQQSEMPQDAPFNMGEPDPADNRNRTSLTSGNPGTPLTNNGTTSGNPGAIQNSGVLHERIEPASANDGVSGLTSTANPDELLVQPVEDPRKGEHAAGNTGTSDSGSENDQTTTKGGEDYHLELPNVFTPNGDGDNDVLVFNPRGLTDFSVVILDRNNKVIIKSNDPAFAWDGNYPDHTPAPEGTYFYMIVARDRAGNPVTRYKAVDIVRSR